MNFFKSNTTSAAGAAKAVEKMDKPSKLDLTDVSPESVVTSDNFTLIDGVLFGAVEISPDMAECWLTKNKNIRHTQIGKIGLFKQSMLDNQWDLNGESIKFDKDGNLVDGQNRLTACVEAGVPFKSNVVYGIESALNVDRGKSRTAGQIIRAMGIAYDANIISAMANYLYAYNDSGSKGFATVGHGKYSFTMDATVAFIESNIKDLNHSCSITQKSKRIFNRYSLHATLHYIFSQVAGESLATEFYHKLVEGTGLSSDDPVYHLREKLLKERASGKSSGINQYAGLIIKGWNHFICGKRVASLPYSYERDGVPRIMRSPLSSK